jgi:hypothetical protein
MAFIINKRSKHSGSEQGWMNRRSRGWRNWVKTITLLVSASFVFPYLAFAFQPSTYPAQSGKISAVPAFQANGAPVEVAPDLGRVVSSYHGKSGKTVVYIHDLHCNYEVQSNIAGLLGNLARKNKLSLIGVEGESRPVNVSRLAAFPRASVKTRTGQYFLKRGRITGAEYLAATGSQPLVLEGIEDQALYDQNKVTLLKFLSEEAQGYCEDLKAIVEKLKAPLYSTDLAKLDHFREQFEGETVSLETYCVFLLEQGKKQGVPLAPFPRLNLFAQEHRLPLATDSDYDKLVDDAAELDRAVREKLYTSPDQRLLDHYAALLKIMADMLAISATAKEIDYYRAHTSEFSVTALVGFLDNLSFRNGVSSNLDTGVVKLDEYLKLAGKFYDVADRRSEAFVLNTLEQMDRHRQSLAVLITGGFHNPRVEAAFQAHGVSYLTVKPRITHTYDENPYFSLLRNRRAPVEELLAKSQNNFAPPSAFNDPVFVKYLTSVLNISLLQELMDKSHDSAEFQGAYLQALKEYVPSDGRSLFDFGRMQSNLKKKVYAFPVNESDYSVLLRPSAVVTDESASLPFVKAREDLGNGYEFQIVETAALAAHRSQILGLEETRQSAWQSLTSALAAAARGIKSLASSWQPQAIAAAVLLVALVGSFSLALPAAALASVQLVVVGSILFTGYVLLRNVRTPAWVRTTATLGAGLLAMAVSQQLGPWVMNLSHSVGQVLAPVASTGHAGYLAAIGTLMLPAAGVIGNLTGAQKGFGAGVVQGDDLIARAILFSQQTFGFGKPEFEGTTFRTSVETLVGRLQDLSGEERLPQAARSVMGQALRDPQLLALLAVVWHQTPLIPESAEGTEANALSPEEKVLAFVWDLAQGEELAALLKEGKTVPLELLQSGNAYLAQLLRAAAPQGLVAPAVPAPVKVAKADRQDAEGLPVVSLAEMGALPRYQAGVEANIYRLNYDGREAAFVAIKEADPRDTLSYAEGGLAREKYEAHFLARFKRYQTMQDVEYQGARVVPGVQALVRDSQGRLVGYIMDFVPGETVDALARRGALNPGQLEKIGDQVRGQLQALHAKGFFHGSPHARNVLVTFDAQGEPHARLIDFGTVFLESGSEKSDTKTFNIGLMEDGRRLIAEQAKAGTRQAVAPDLPELIWKYNQARQLEHLLTVHEAWQAVWVQAPAEAKAKAVELQAAVKAAMKAAAVEFDAANGNATRLEASRKALDAALAGINAAAEKAGLPQGPAAALQTWLRAASALSEAWAQGIPRGAKPAEMALGAGVDALHPEKLLALSVMGDQTKALADLAQKLNVKLSVQGPIFSTVLGFHPEEDQVVSAYAKTVDVARALGLGSVTVQAPLTAEGEERLAAHAQADAEKKLALVALSHEAVQPLAETPARLRVEDQSEPPVLAAANTVRVRRVDLKSLPVGTLVNYSRDNMTWEYTLRVEEKGRVSIWLRRDAGRLSAPIADIGSINNPGQAGVIDLSMSSAMPDFKQTAFSEGPRRLLESPSGGHGSEPEKIWVQLPAGAVYPAQALVAMSEQEVAEETRLGTLTTLQTYIVDVLAPQIWPQTASEAPAMASYRRVQEERIFRIAQDLGVNQVEVQALMQAAAAEIKKHTSPKFTLADAQKIAGRLVLARIPALAPPVSKLRGAVAKAATWVWAGISKLAFLSAFLGAKRAELQVSETVLPAEKDGTNGKAPNNSGASRHIGFAGEGDDFAAVWARAQQSETALNRKALNRLEARRNDVLQALTPYLTVNEYMSFSRNLAKLNTLTLATVSGLKGAIGLNRWEGGTLQLVLESGLPAKLAESTILHEAMEALLKQSGIKHAHALAFIAESEMYPQSLAAKLENEQRYPDAYLQALIDGTGEVVEAIQDADIPNTIRAKQLKNAQAVWDTAQQILTERQQGALPAGAGDWAATPVSALAGTVDRFKAADPKLLHKGARDLTDLKDPQHTAVKDVYAQTDMEQRPVYQSYPFKTADGSAFRIWTGERVAVVLPQGGNVVLGSTDFSSCAAAVIKGVNGRGETVMELAHLEADNEKGQLPRLQQSLSRLRAQGVKAFQVFVHIDPVNAKPGEGFYNIWPGTLEEIQAALGPDVQVAVDRKPLDAKGQPEMTNVYATPQGVMLEYAGNSSLQPRFFEWSPAVSAQAGKKGAPQGGQGKAAAGAKKFKRITVEQTKIETTEWEEYARLFKTAEAFSKKVLTRPDEDILALVNQVTGKRLVPGDVTGETGISFFKEGSNKMVFKVKLELTAQGKKNVGETLVEMTIVTKVGKTGKDIAAVEIDDLKKMSKSDLTPRFGTEFEYDDLRYYVEEFIAGPLARQEAEENRLTPERRGLIIKTLLGISLLLGGLMPQDIHANNFILNQKDSRERAVMVDIGNQRTTPDRALLRLVAFYGYFGKTANKGNNRFIFQSFVDEFGSAGLDNGLLLLKKNLDHIRNMQLVEAQKGRPARAPSLSKKQLREERGEPALQPEDITRVLAECQAFLDEYATAGQNRPLASQGAATAVSDDEQVRAGAVSLADAPAVVRTALVNQLAAAGVQVQSDGTGVLNTRLLAEKVQAARAGLAAEQAALQAKRAPSLQDRSALKNYSRALEQLRGIERALAAGLRPLTIKLSNGMDPRRHGAAETIGGVLYLNAKQAGKFAEQDRFKLLKLVMHEVSHVAGMGADRQGEINAAILGRLASGYQMGIMDVMQEVAKVDAGGKLFTTAETSGRMAALGAAGKARSPQADAVFQYVLGAPAEKTALEGTPAVQEYQRSLSALTAMNRVTSMGTDAEITDSDKLSLDEGLKIMGALKTAFQGVAGQTVAEQKELSGGLVEYTEMNTGLKLFIDAGEPVSVAELRAKGEAKMPGNIEVATEVLNLNAPAAGRAAWLKNLALYMDTVFKSGNHNIGPHFHIGSQAPIAKEDIPLWRMAWTEVEGYVLPMLSQIIGNVTPALPLKGDYANNANLQPTALGGELGGLADWIHEGYGADGEEMLYKYFNFVVKNGVPEFRMRYPMTDPTQVNRAFVLFSAVYVYMQNRVARAQQPAQGIAAVAEALPFAAYYTQGLDAARAGANFGKFVRTLNYIIGSQTGDKQARFFDEQAMQAHFSGQYLPTIERIKAKAREAGFIEQNHLDAKILNPPVDYPAVLRNFAQIADMRGYSYGVQAPALTGFFGEQTQKALTALLAGFLASPQAAQFAGPLQPAVALAQGAVTGLLGSLDMLQRAAFFAFFGHAVQREYSAAETRDILGKALGNWQAAFKVRATPEQARMLAGGGRLLAQLQAGQAVGITVNGEQRLLKQLQITRLQSAPAAAVSAAQREHAQKLGAFFSFDPATGQGTIFVMPGQTLQTAALHEFLEFIGNHDHAAVQDLQDGVLAASQRELEPGAGLLAAGAGPQAGQPGSVKQLAFQAQGFVSRTLAGRTARSGAGLQAVEGVLQEAELGITPQSGPTLADRLGNLLAQVRPAEAVPASLNLIPGLFQATARFSATVRGGLLNVLWSGLLALPLGGAIWTAVLALMGPSLRTALVDQAVARVRSIGTTEESGKVLDFVSALSDIPGMEFTPLNLELPEGARTLNIPNEIISRPALLHRLLGPILNENNIFQLQQRFRLTTDGAA